MQRRIIRYDKAGDRHYDVVSAFIKSLRGSDADAALYWLHTMLEAGEDPEFIARRMIILASEDVGLADNRALGLAVAAFDALRVVGLPEASYALSHAAVYLALAPKSNSVTLAMGAAREAVADTPAAAGARPPPIRRHPRREGARPRGRLPVPARQPERRARPAVSARRGGRHHRVPARAPTGKRRHWPSAWRRWTASWASEALNAGHDVAGGPPDVER